MTDKEIDNLFSKQDIRLSSAFNDAVLAKMKSQDSTIDELFLEENLSLKPSFNDDVLDDARIEDFFARDRLFLDDSFADSVFAKIEEGETPARRVNVWSIMAKVSAIAAVFVGGLFLFNETLVEHELLDTDSNIYITAKENINTEIDYCLLEVDINALSSEIDRLEVALLEEIDSYYSNRNI